MLVAVRWTQIRLYYCIFDKSYYVQLGDEVFYKINAITARSIGSKLQIEIKDVKNIVSMQNLAKNDKSS